MVTNIVRVYFSKTGRTSSLESTEKPKKKKGKCTQEYPNTNIILAWGDQAQANVQEEITVNQYKVDQRALESFTMLLFCSKKVCTVSVEWPQITIC